MVAQVVDTTEIPDPRSIPALALAQRASRSTMTDTMRKRDQLLVSGRVLDETGEPVTGATVSLENSTSGTVTDMDGMFRLSVPKGEKGSLIAEYVGMKKSTFPLKENVGDITLKADELALNETVIVGFGTMKKADKVGFTAAMKEAPTRADTQAMDQAVKEVVDGVVEREQVEKKGKAREVEAMVFGKKEFREYFITHYDKSLCQGDSIAFTVTFSIGSNGRPTGIQIKRTAVPTSRPDQRLLLGSPHGRTPTERSR